MLAPMAGARDCCLCSQIAGQPQNDLIARLLPGQPYARRIMLESAGFAAIPSLGPLARGHSLLCPRQHVPSFAALDSGLEGDYRAIKAALKARLGAQYRAEVLVFEHGSDARGERVLCTVDHAHLHFVPVPEGGIELPRGHGWIEIDDRLASLRDLAGGREYVLYETPAGVRRLLVPGEAPIESQYMRRIIGQSLGRAQSWNWREAPDPAGADRTWRSFLNP